MKILKTHLKYYCMENIYDISVYSIGEFIVTSCDDDSEGKESLVCTIQTKHIKDINNNNVSHHIYIKNFLHKGEDLYIGTMTYITKQFVLLSVDSVLSSYIKVKDIRSIVIMYLDSYNNLLREFIDSINYWLHNYTVETDIRWMLCKYISDTVCLYKQHELKYDRYPVHEGYVVRFFVNGENFVDIVNVPDTDKRSLIIHDTELGYGSYDLYNNIFSCYLCYCDLLNTEEEDIKADDRGCPDGYENMYIKLV